MKRKLEKLNPDLLKCQIDEDQQSNVIGGLEQDRKTCVNNDTYVGYPNGDYQRCWDGCGSEGCDSVVCF